ncbi:prephenate dehydrogenase [Spirillospora sp. NPDC052269]
MVGSGLMGTSLGLALTAKGWRVSLADRDPGVALAAERRGAGRALTGDDPDEPADVVVLAVPPREVGSALADAQKRRLGRAYTDVCSVKERPTAEASELGCDMASFVAGHPLAGREKSGPQAARADLFAGLPWVLCPDAETAPEALAAVLALVRASGAEPVRLGRTEHDRATALVSHAPHVVSAAMAAQLRPAEDATLRLAGRGVADVTRKAAAAPGLWTEILVGNALPVAGVLEDVAGDLTRTAAALRASALEGTPDAEREVHELLRHGQEGRARMMAAGALGDLAGEER